jgi:hypothetical protein
MGTPRTLQDRAIAIGALLSAPVDADLRPDRRDMEPRRVTGTGPAPVDCFNAIGSRLCRDEVQPGRGRQIKRIADQGRRRIDRRVHLDLPQQLFSSSGTKNGHAAFKVPYV